MPQNKKTKAAPVANIDELPELNENEQVFVQWIVAGKPLREAYKLAYGAEGYSEASLRVRASRKAGETNIRQHVAFHQQLGMANALLTRDDWVEHTLAAAYRAEASGNHGAAMTGRIAVGKALGFQADQTEDITPRDPFEILERIAKTSPDLAAQLAKDKGIDWTPATQPADDEDTVH